MNNISSATKETLMSEVKKLIPKLRKVSTKKAKELADSISYAGNMYKKDPTKVTKKDLVDFFNQASKMLAMPASASSTPATPEKKSSTSLKPTGKKVAEVENLTKAGSKAKSVKKADEPKEEPAKKPAATKKKEEPKVEKVTKTKEVFPETISLETEDGDVEYTKTDVSSMEELCELLSDEDTDAVVAFYWNPSEIKKKYPKETNKMKTLKSFDNDLDIALPVYISDEGEMVYLVSLYTEAFYDILKYEVTDEAEKYAGGLRFNLYVAQ